jgi:hypothetical protein
MQPGNGLKPEGAPLVPYPKRQLEAIYRWIVTEVLQCLDAVCSNMVSFRHFIYGGAVVLFLCIGRPEARPRPAGQHCTI